ncbi:hypothetical protein BDQ17DRAFT_1436052 [Cyathus striatus]|nr:hypothetical protein BDQ17DRAFT_1436052 [Cyathus striatus]
MALMFALGGNGMEDYRLLLQLVRGARVEEDVNVVFTSCVKDILGSLSSNTWFFIYLAAPSTPQVENVPTPPDTVTTASLQYEMPLFNHQYNLA